MVLFEKSRLWADIGFHLLPSFHHLTQHNYTTHSYTYSHPNLNFLQYTIRILVPHVMWSAQAVRELEIDHTERFLSASRNPKQVIVQWVGRGTNKHCSSFPTEVPSSNFDGVSGTIVVDKIWILRFSSASSRFLNFILLNILHIARSDGSMSASGSVSPGFDPRRG